MKQEDIDRMEYLNKYFLENKLWIVRPISTRVYKCIFCKGSEGKPCLFGGGKGEIIVKEWGYNSVSKLVYKKVYIRVYIREEENKRESLIQGEYYAK